VALGPRSHLVLVTRGHKYDFDALNDVLRRPEEVAYIGMVGSRRRTRAALEQLARRASPGSGCGGSTRRSASTSARRRPEEIAVAIAAELVRTAPRRQRPEPARPRAGGGAVGGADDGRSVSDDE
jgi:xanthine dehydrogenase accessory factor